MRSTASERRSRPRCGRRSPCCRSAPGSASGSPTESVRPVPRGGAGVARPSPRRPAERPGPSAACLRGRMARTAEPPTIHVVAVVGSAGGIRAIQVVLGALPADLDACVLVVIHLTPLAPSLLPAILGRATELQVAPGFDGAPL